MTSTLTSKMDIYSPQLLSCNASTQKDSEHEAQSWERFNDINKLLVKTAEIDLDRLNHNSVET